MKTAILSLTLLISLLLEGMVWPGVKAQERSDETLLVYLYLPASNPREINFTVEELEIKRKGGEWVKLSKKPLPVKSLDIADDQILLAESRVGEGEYERLRMRASHARVRRGEKYFDLALPRDGRVLDIRVALKIRRGECTALFLTWAPDKSISDNYLFTLAVEAGSQDISPRTQLLYVANSGSNYISIIDRFENRVVGIIGVEKNPTGLVLSKDREMLYVLNSGSNSISVIETTHDYVLDRIQLVSGTEPIEMAMIPDPNNTNHGKLYITNRRSNDVTVVDTYRKSQIKSILVGISPLGIAANPVRGEVYVANTGSNSISIIDSVANDTVKATINVDTMPVDIVVITLGKKDYLYVLSRGSNRITVIDPATKQITGTIPAGTNPRKAIYSEQYNKIYLTNYDSGRVSFLIPASAMITGSVNVGEKPVGLAIDEVRNQLFITGYGSNSVAVVNPVAEVVEKTIPVGNKPYGIVSLQ